MKPCPNCAEQVQDAAKACRFCGYDFTRKKMPKKSPAPPNSFESCIGCLGAVLLALVLIFILSSS